MSGNNSEADAAYVQGETDPVVRDRDGDGDNEIQVQIPIGGESVLLGNSEFLVHSPVDLCEAEQIPIAQLHDLAVQESSSMQVEFSDPDDGVMVSRPGSEEFDSEDAKVAEDGGKEDMFVDAPDVLIGFDGRSIDSSVTVVRKQDNLEETNEVVETHFHDNYRRENYHSVDEVQDLRFMLEKAVREREILVQENTDLNTMVSELSLSRDVVASYLDSLWSQSVEVMSQSQLQKEQHMEAGLNRMLASVGSFINPEESFDESIVGKMTHVERSVTLLTENYNYILFEIDQLKHLLTEPGTGQESGSVLVAARTELDQLRSGQAELAKKLSHLEAENNVLVEQLDQRKGLSETMIAESGKLKAELEQEKTRSANTKEKLSMAVTKGKALIQQRDSLRQTIAEKTSELEKCLVELQEKSSALEEKSNALQAAELSKEELSESANMAASLQEALSQRNTILENVEVILSQTTIPDELQSMTSADKIRWLVDEKAVLGAASLELLKVKDVLSLSDLPEELSSEDLGSKLNWFKESLFQAKEETAKLQESLVSTSGAAHKEIDSLTASLSAEIQEKSYLQTELDDMQSKYDELLRKEQELTLSMDRVVRILLDASGSTEISQEGVIWDSIENLIERCLEKVKEQNSASYLASHAETENFERVVALLFIKDQELALCNEILEEDIMERSKLNTLLENLQAETKELPALKLERDSLQTDLQKLEEKFAMVREKLSMAVKKGKGLFQDRENLKGVLDEKNQEIEKLKLELQEQESALGGHKDRISILSTELECIPKLEMDIIGLNDQKDQLEKYLVESNNMLTKVMESIDEIATESVFKEPVEKVKWLAWFCVECQTAKTSAEQELEKVREDASNFAVKFQETTTTIKSLEDALVVAENEMLRLAEEKSVLEAGKSDMEEELQRAIEGAQTHISRSVEVSALTKSLEDALSEAEKTISRSTEEKRVLETDKESVEQELQKALEDAEAHFRRYTEVSAIRKSLEDALSEAESHISALVLEKEDANTGRAAAETDIEKFKEEVAIQTTKLAEAYVTVKTLEDAQLQAATQVSLLNEENNSAQAGRTDLERELKQLKEVLVSQAGNMDHANITIKSLEDALLVAENKISVLVHEKEVVQEEILTLNSKLDACMEELSGTHGTLENRSVELAGHLQDLKAVLKDQSTLYLMRKSFEKHFEKLKQMEVNLKDIRGHCIEMGVKGLEHFPIEGDSFDIELFSEKLDKLSTREESNSADNDNILSQFRFLVDGFHSTNKTLEINFDDISSFMDQYTTAVLESFQATKDDVIVLIQQTGSLKQELTNMELYKQTYQETVSILENQVASLVSACADATKELQLEIENIPLEPSSVCDVENDELSAKDSIYVETANNLLLTTRKAQNLVKQLEAARKLSISEVEELQSKFEEKSQSLEKTTEERNLSQMRVSELENKVGKLQNVCSEMKLEVEHLQAKQEKLKESDTKVSASVSEIEDLQNSLGNTENSLRKAIEERNISQSRILELETNVEELQKVCSELKLEVRDLQEEEKRLKEREAEVSLSYNTLLKKEQDKEEPLLSAFQLRTLFEKIRVIETSFAESEVEKLFSILDNFTELQHQMKLLVHDKEELQSTISGQNREIRQLKEEVEKHTKNSENLGKTKGELSDLALGLEKMILKLGGCDIVGDQSPAGTKGLAVLEKFVASLIADSENSKSKAHELGTKLIGSQKVVDDLSNKVKSLEESRQSRTAPLPEIVQERSIFEAPSLPSTSEISEIEDAGPLAKNVTAAQMRSMRKGSTDHLVLDIGTESDRLLNEDKDEDKGHMFKSLNTSGIIPIQGKLLADRVDGIWVSGGRLLMSRPRARLGLIAYWLLIHLWLLGTIF